MKWFLLVLFSFRALGQIDDDQKLYCQKVLSDHKSLLIYRVKDEAPDPLGDLALWRSFKMKVIEKVPTIVGNKTLMHENQKLRLLSRTEKEKRLRCFHGPSYTMPLSDRNILEDSYPLLDVGDVDKLLTIYNEKIKREPNLQSVIKEIENFNSQPGHHNLKVPDDLVGVESKTNPLKQKQFDQMIKNVICHSGIRPVKGENDLWNEEFKDENTTPPFSKLLVALASGDTSRFMPTMKEKPLMEWILDQKDRSVTIHGIFEKSFILNQGNVYKTLMTIENVLSENFYLGEMRERLTSTTKLSKIINHTGGQFDLYGPWYHLFGMMLYGYAEGSGLEAKLMGMIETGTSLFYKERNDRQENYMIAGGKIGARLKRAVKKIKTNEDFKKYCEGVMGEISISDYLNIEK
jgi:hypothetical protein